MTEKNVSNKHRWSLGLTAALALAFTAMSSMYAFGVVGDNATSGAAPSDSPTASCGSAPATLMVPASYGAPSSATLAEGPSREASQVVQTWNAGSASIELRWPADMDRQPSSLQAGAAAAAVSMDPVQLASNRYVGRFFFSFVDSPCILEVSAADSDRSALNATVTQISHRPFVPSKALVTSREKVDAIPGVEGCHAPQGVSAPANRVISGTHDAYPSPESALAAYVQANFRLASADYAEADLPDGSIAFVSKNPMGDVVALIHVASAADSRWIIDSIEVSGC